MQDNRQFSFGGDIGSATQSRATSRISALVKAPDQWPEVSKLQCAVVNLSNLRLRRIDFVAFWFVKAYTLTETQRSEHVSDLKHKQSGSA
jgi:hypothetical protein